MNRTWLGSEVKRENGSWVGNGFVSFHFFFVAFGENVLDFKKYEHKKRAAVWAPQGRNTSWQGQG